MRPRQGAGGLLADQRHGKSESRDIGPDAYHPCGSCRMGDGDDAVVDGQGRVHGLEGPRVVDASLFPVIPTGNLNAPTIMLAEKIADRIRGRVPLPRSDAPYYVASDAPARKEPRRRLN